MKISIIIGSTRRGRKSHSVGKALKTELAKREGVSGQVIDLVDLPIHQFEGRLNELSPVPPVLVETAEILQDSEALIFITPEYNGSFSGSLKNFIDVFSRKEFGQKPIGVATVSAGKMGGVRAAYQLQQVILSIGGFPLSQMLLTANIDQNLNESGKIITEDYLVMVNKFLDGFLGFVEITK